MGIFPVGEGRACTCHHKSCLLRLCHDRLRAAVHGVKGDKISTQRLDPRADLQSAQFSLEDVNDCLEFRPHDIRMFFHMLHNAVYIFEKAHMTELIHLVVSDRLELKHISDIL